MRIVCIPGSLREASCSRRLLNLIGEALQTQGVEIELLDLREWNLPFCSGEASYPEYPDVSRFQQTIREADALVLCTPEYHGSLSGVMKNALDLLDNSILEGKVVGLSSVLGGDMSMNAVNSLRMICRQVHSFVIPEQVIVSHCDRAFDDKGALLDDRMSKRVQRFAEMLVNTTRKMK